MPDATSLQPAPDAPAYVIGLGNAVMLRLSAYAVLLCFLAAGVFSSLTGGSGSGGAASGWVEPALFIAVYLGTVVLHELVHGLFFRVFGGSPRYGAGFKYLMPYFYATSPGDAFTVRQMIVVGLAPLLVISTASLVVALTAPVLAGYLAVVFIGNTAGAIGDIWMISRLLRFLAVSDATVVDLKDGMAVYSREPAAGIVAGALSARDRRPAGFVVHWIGAALAVLMAGGVAGIIGPMFTDDLLIGPAQLPLLTFTKSSAGLAWTFNLASPLLAGLIFALAWLLFSHRVRRPTGPASIH